MKSSRIPSPARSQGVITTPRQNLRRTRSVGSPARTNLRLSSITSESLKLSPLPSRRSVLNDDTDIEVPGHRSWWKKIDDNSRDIQELLESKDMIEVKNVADEFDVEVLSQENKNYTLDLPDSSDGESINSIIIPQRKLFTQTEKLAQKKFGQIVNRRESSNKPDKSHFDQENEVNFERKNLFSQPSKPRPKPVFPAALLNVSANRNVNKTKEIAPAEVKGQVRSLFGGLQGTKRKNMFADFIVSESEDEIPEIQPRVSGFQKKNEPQRRASSMSHHSTTSSTDIEVDEWRHLPSSTLVENELLEASPVKRAKLDGSSDGKVTKITDIYNSLNATNTANKSRNSKNKSKNISKTNFLENEQEVNEINIKPKNTTMDNSRVTRSKSLRENSVTTPSTPRNISKSKHNSKSNNTSTILKSIKTVQNMEEKDNVLDQRDCDEDITLQYDNEEIETPNATIVNHSPKDKSHRNVNVELVTNRSIDNSNKGKEMKEHKSIDKTLNSQKEVRHNEDNIMEINEENISKETSFIENQSRHKQDVLISQRRTLDEQKDSKNNSKSGPNSSNQKNNKRVNDNNHNNGASEELTDMHKENSIELNESKEDLNGEAIENKEASDKEDKCESDAENDVDMEGKHNETTPVKQNVGQGFNSPTKEGNKDLEIEEEHDEIDNGNCGNKEREMLSNKKQSVKNVSSSNVSHDTTGRHRKKEIHNKSPEVALHYDNTNQKESFTVQGRNTSVRKTKSIIFKNKSIRHSLAQVRESTGFSDGTRDSSAEGSGWDSHRTTRKTLRQTFGKDFTPRKSLRALVLEKTAKLQASNYKEVEEIKKKPMANSTAYGEVHSEFHSYQEPVPLQVEESIESIQNEEKDEMKQHEDVTSERSNKKERDKERAAAYQSYVENKKTAAKSDEATTAGQSHEEEQNNDEISEPPHGEEQNEELVADQSDEEQNEEVTADQSDDKEQDEEVTADQSDDEEQNEEVIADQSDDEEQNEEVIADQSDDEEQNEEVIADQSDDEEQNEEVTADQSDDEEQNEEVTADQTDEEEQHEEVTADQSDDEEQHEEVTTDQSDDEEQSDNATADRSDEMIQENEMLTNSSHIFLHGDDIRHEQSDHEVSKHTRQTTLETYLQTIKRDNAERKRKMEEEIRKSLKVPKTDAYNLFKVPQKPVRRTVKQQKPNVKTIKSVIPIEMLPSEFIEDKKYKPPKRFQPNNASWITKRLYKFLETKLEPKYDYKARIRAEKLVESIYTFTKEVRRHEKPCVEGIGEIKREMARLDIVKTHFDFYEFCHEFLPREIRVKVVPDIVNKIPLPRPDVFSDIVR